MNLQLQLQNDNIIALKNKDSVRRMALSFLVSEIKTRAVNKRVELLSDAEVISLLQKQLKQREESLSAAKKYNRAEMIEKNKYEISLIQSYLPKTISKEETISLAKSVISQLTFTSMRDMGMRDMSKVMQTIIATNPAVDKGLLSSIVKAELSGGQ